MFAKKLTIFSFGNSGKFDDTFFADVVFPNKLKCVWGILLCCTDRRIDFVNYIIIEYSEFNTDNSTCKEPFTSLIYLFYGFFQAIEKKCHKANKINKPKKKK